MDVNNQGLNLPSNLQNLDVRNELLSTEVGSGASCAYSLRDLTGSNKKVARVRREPHDTTNSIDDERIFGGQEVQAGYLEDWVNGKLEHTLPGDIATARSLHSLRKIRSGYNGDALRIRRIDNTEVDVAFDSDGKVSTSSSITNIESGDVDNTGETTLGNFLKGEANVRALFNSSAYFPTDSDYFSLGSGITLSGAFTISFDVVFTGSFGTNTSRIFQDDAGNDLLTFTASTTCKFRVGSIVRTMSALSTPLQLGRKYSMIFARDGSGNYTLTIDGVQVSTLSGTDTDDFLIQRIGFRNRGSISNLNINSGQHIYAGDGAENSNWTDTGSGTTTNATKVGSPVAFTGQGMDSFVHTWYDQAGSNDAVQETAANQPKIAEGGALLADGIDFDGSNDELRTSTNIASSQPVTVFSVTKPDAVNKRIFESITNSVRAFYGGSSQTGMNAGNTLLGSTNEISTNTEYLQTHLFNTTNSKVFLNNVETISGDAGSNAFAGNFSLGGSSAVFDGTMKELIVYTSDQSDNRFKIESNINNYYGLYNDANELSAAFDSNGTITNESKDGFTADVATFSHYVNATFNNSVATGETIYVSFNAQLAPNGGTSASPILRLQDAQVGSNTSNQSSISEGFNSIDLTATGTSDRVGFLEQDDNVDYIISDFKVSRIARNGFVETWYDQSANLRDAIQETATNQPKIVSNGGIVKVNSKPAITFDGNDNFLEVDGSGSAVAYSFSPSGDMGMFIVSKQSTGNPVDSRDGAGDGIFLQQASADTTRFRYNGDGSIDITATRDAQHFSTMTLDGTTLSASVDGGTAGTDTVTAGVSTTSNLVLGKAFSGNNSNFVDGEIQEAIFYENNKTSEKSDIETDIDNFYSIT